MDSTVLLTDAAFAMLFVVIGIFAGWWLRKPEALRAAACAAPQREREREVAQKIQALAELVAHDVGEHSLRIQELSGELEAAAGGESTVVGEVVVRSLATILEANQKLQHQLASAEIQLQRQAQELQVHAAEARRDPLTGLSNRRALDDELKRRFHEWKRRGNSFSIVMFDIDHFKDLNDRHGHQAGDAVLKSVAAELEQSIRAMDLAVRYGGEEFCLVLPTTEAHNAALVSERARALIAAGPFNVGGQNQQVTVSAGVAEIQGDEDLETLIHRADQALYAAKNNGRNCVFVNVGEQNVRYRELAAAATASLPPASAASAGRTSAAAAPAIAVNRPVEGQRQPEDPPAHARPERCDPRLGAAPDPSPGVAARPAAATIDWIVKTEFGDEVKQRFTECRTFHLPMALVVVEINDYARLLAELGAAQASKLHDALRDFLSASLAKVDLVGTTSAERIAVLMPGSTQEVAERAVGNLCREFEGEQSQSWGVGARFSLSHGAVEGSACHDVRHLIEDAERSLAAAKHATPNATMRGEAAPGSRSSGATSPAPMIASDNPTVATPTPVRN